MDRQAQSINALHRPGTAQASRACSKKRPLATMHDTTRDLALANDILDGNVNKFELVLREHQEQVVRIVNRHLPREHVEEVAHEVFIRAFKSLKTYKGEKPLAHWISTIAVRQCYDFWRTHYKKRETPASALTTDAQDGMEKLLAASSKDQFEDAARLKETKELLHWALSQIKPEDRMVLTLTFLEEHSTKEAAELLGWSVANVKVRSFRARKKLATILARAAETT